MARYRLKPGFKHYGSDGHMIKAGTILELDPEVVRISNLGARFERLPDASPVTAPAPPVPTPAADTAPEPENDPSVTENAGDPAESGSVEDAGGDSLPDTLQGTPKQIKAQLAEINDITTLNALREAETADDYARASVLKEIDRRIKEVG